MLLKFFMKVCAVCVPVVLVMAIVNYSIDPALVIREYNYSEQVATGILEGYNVAIDTNFNERKLQRLLIYGNNRNFDRVILGSSRVMSIPTEAFGLGDCFINGVSGAVIEDIIGIIGMYDIDNTLPHEFVLGIDPWLLNENHGNTRYLELTDEYNDYSERLGISLLSVSRFIMNTQRIVQLLSPTYFQASLRSISLSPKKLYSAIMNSGLSIDPIIIDGVSLETTTILSDGSVVYNEARNNLSEEEVIRSVENDIVYNGLYQSSNYLELSPDIVQRFTILTDYLLSNNVSIVFLIAPLHPLMYQHVEENREYAMVLKSEEFVRDFAESRGIPVIGSFDPGRLGATGADFYDAIHPTREFMAALCENAFAR